MSKRHGAREQKKLSKQKAKRDARRRQLVRLNSPNPMVRLGDAFDWPVIEALIPETLWKTGIGNVLIARRTRDKRIAVGAFLLDVYCLGVKNAFWSVVTSDGYDTIVRRVSPEGRLKYVSPEYLSKLVHCAADYAQSLGLAPHPDFRHVRLLLAGIDPSHCPEEFVFGKDGKPYYIAGPNDSPARIRQVVERVTAAGGHYIVPIGPGSDVAELPMLDHEPDNEIDVEPNEYDDQDDDEPDDEVDRVR